jgi:hypothetical protein
MRSIRTLYCTSKVSNLIPQAFRTDLQDAGTSCGYEYVPTIQRAQTASYGAECTFYDTYNILADTQSGDRQTGRKAQLSNITAAKT